MGRRAKDCRRPAAAFCDGDAFAGGAEVENYVGLQGRGHEFAAISRPGLGPLYPRSPSGLPLGAGSGELAPTPRGFPAHFTGMLACRDPERHQRSPPRDPN